MKIHPSIRAELTPIVDEMTRIYNRNKTNPMMGPHNESEYDKMIKRRCVHYVKDEHDEWRIAVKKNGDDYICEACGRKVNIKFDQTAVDSIMKTIEVLDGLALFAPAQGLLAPPLQTIISVKEVLPMCAKIQAEFNEFVKRDDAANGAGGGGQAGGIVSDYNTPQRFSGLITGAI